ncbi:MAG: hypothetical protein LBS31_06160 [Candidatus Adiutrix sp.]|jgi:DNA polymerase-3 subunit delta'|nr:hypothetical protein [Candidatus Adiutrix sp.]
MGWGLLGLEGVTGKLAAMIAGGRLPHALIFTGPRGAGKRSLGLALARALNCENPDAADRPCGQCPPCLKIDRGVHPDVRTLAPSGRSRQIKMEDVQALRAETAFRPYEGRAKVFIVSEADRLNSDSGNALLKTLEEPPPDSILILTSASESEVMATIVSRCLRLRLPPLAYDLMLSAIEEKRDLTGPVAGLLAVLAAGALGPALNLDPDETWRDWSEMDAAMGAAPAPARLEAAWRWVEARCGDEEKFPALLNVMRLWWRQTALLSVPELPLREGPPPSEAQRLWAARLTPKALEEIGRALGKLEDSLARFVKPELAFENYWLTVLRV